jgi:acetyl-CoA acetyltransferase
MAEAYIIDAVRTPRGIGKVGKGALAHMHPQHLAATVLSALAERNKLDITRQVWGHGEVQGGPGGNKEANEGSFARVLRGVGVISPKKKEATGLLQNDSG